MKKLLFSLSFIVSFSLVTSISYASVDVKNKKTAVQENEESFFKPNFIKADDLLKKVQRNEKIILIDVRGKVAYDEAHIKGAIMRELPITPESVKDIPKNAEVVTYCGCPHHLSGIAAEQMTNMGYRNVKVLDEGFNFWKDHKYPLSKNAGDTTEIIVSGTLLKDKKPVSGVNIYLKHEATGQLEATRTEKNGNYKMTFHIYKYKPKDKFKFYLDSALKKPIQDFSTDKKENKNIVVNIK
ncbi:MAG: rhodanese-like domain-containing protein [Candidatus Sericytochromatia bacterium]